MEGWEKKEGIEEASRKRLNDHVQTDNPKLEDSETDNSSDQLSEDRDDFFRNNLPVQPSFFHSKEIMEKIKKKTKKRPI